MRQLPEPISRRLAPAAGVAGTALAFGGMLATTATSSETSPDSSPATIAASYEAHADRTRTGVWLALVGLSLLFWFVPYLRQRIRDAEGPDGRLGSVAYAGGIVAMAGIALFLAVKVAASGPGIGGNEGAAATFLLFEWEFAGVLAPAFAALVGATSLASVRFGILPRGSRWLAWLGLPLAAALAAAGFLGGALVVSSLLWLLAVALALTVRPPAI